jgi:hypothetical protein
MIVRVFNAAQLKLFAPELNRCFEDFCRRASDSLDADGLWRVLLTSLQGWNFAFWLALGDRARVQGFAMTRIIHDEDGTAIGDLWRVYVSPTAPQGVFAEGLTVIEEWFRAQGADEMNFATKRNAEAWQRRLHNCGFEPDMVIFKKKVIADGQPTSGICDPEPDPGTVSGLHGLDQSGDSIGSEQPGSADDPELGDHDEPDL